MAKNITVGIDIGTYQVKVVVAEALYGKNKGAPKILGAGYAESKGLRHGYIISMGETVKSILSAVAQAEKASGIKIKKAFISVGGIGLNGTVSTGISIVSRADGEVTELDIKKVLETAENEIPATVLLNRKVIHVIPLQYKIEGKVVHGKVLGLKATKLEVKALFISCLSQHLQDLIQAIEEAGVEVIDVMASPIAASLVTLTKAQKIAGCVLANIGAETVTIVVFENDIPISLEVFPIGGTDITNDIALGLRIPLEEAEQIKMGAITGTSYSKRKLDEIVEARLSDIFELIEAHLKKIGRNGLLPAGVIITGGGGKISTIEELAKATLKLPSKLGEVIFGGSVKENLKDSSWAVAYGLCILGFTQNEDGSAGMWIGKGAKNKIINWVKRFLP